MKPHYTDDAVTLYAGDCLDVLPTLPDNSVDAVVTDPPYGLEFMGKEWDAFKPANAKVRTRVDARTNGAAKSVVSVPEAYVAGHPFQQWCQLWAAECLRVLKPGGHLLAFGGTRTWHRLAVAIEDAGFEIRDTIAWLYGSGFPKSLDVSKAIDRANGKPLDRLRGFGTWMRERREAARLTAAEVNRHMAMPQGCGWWEGKGAGEKWDLHLPSLATFRRLKDLYGAGSEWDWLIEWADAERAVIGPNPYNAVRGRSTGTHTIVAPQAPSDITAPATADAQRWQGWGTALKPAHEPIVVARKPLIGTVAANVLAHGTGALNIAATRIGSDTSRADRYNSKAPGGSGFIDHAMSHTEPWQAPAGRWPANVALDETAAAALDRMSGERPSSGDYDRGSQPAGPKIGAASIRIDGNLGATYSDAGGASRFYFTAKAGSDERVSVNGISHPTVKPLSLLRWLVRLVTPPGGVILEPFAGSGTTVEAAILEGFRCIAIEREPDYLPLITQRINRRRDPIAYLTAAGEDLGLFDFEEPP